MKTLKNSFIGVCIVNVENNSEGLVATVIITDM